MSCMNGCPTNSVPGIAKWTTSHRVDFCMLDVGLTTSQQPIINRCSHREKHCGSATDVVQVSSFVSISEVSGPTSSDP